MQKLLRIDSSMRNKGSYGWMYGDLFLQLWNKRNPGATIRYRDLGKDQIPNLAQEGLDAFSQGDNGSGAWKLSERLIGELIESSVLLIVCPPYNFSIPSVLKAYIDPIVRSQMTFVPDPQKGHKGLM